MKEPEFANMVQCSEMIITDGQEQLKSILRILSLSSDYSLITFIYTPTDKKKMFLMSCYTYSVWRMG